MYVMWVFHLIYNFGQKAIKIENLFANIYKIIHARLFAIPTYVSSAILVGQKTKYIYIKIPDPVKYHLFFFNITYSGERFLQPSFDIIHFVCVLYLS